MVRSRRTSEVRSGEDLHGQAIRSAYTQVVVNLSPYAGQNLNSLPIGYR